MRLAISNHGLRNSGGIERYALTLVRGLHARGIRPVFAAKAFDTSLPEHGWVEPVAVSMRFVPGKLRDFWFDRRLRALKAERGWSPLIACNQTGAADIAICGSNHPAYLEAMGQRAGLTDRWKIALERAHLTNAKRVVAHSRLLAQQVVQHYDIDEQKIDVLYPPVDGERFCTVPEERRVQLRQGLGLPSDRAVFLLASTGHKRKGLDLLLDFFQTTTLPVLLAVAGRPIDASGPNLRYLGYRTDIEDVFRAVDFTVIASRYEPFGLVGVESVLCGTPVVMAEGVGCAEVLEGPASVPFTLAHPMSLGTAVERAVERWRSGAHRLASPHDHLGYDPAVAVHLDALLRWAAMDASG